MASLSDPAKGPAVWSGRDMSQTDEWVHRISPELCEALEAAARQVRASGKQAPSFGAADFPLGDAAQTLAQWLREVTTGRGFVLIRGLPIGHLDDRTLRDVFWGLGCHWGRAMTQNAAGDAIAEITDHGLDATQPGVKPSMTNAEQRPHSDPSDVVALLCVRGAAEGGVSRIASTMAIFNRLLADHPEGLDCLHRGFFHDLRGDAMDDSSAGCTPMPIPVYRRYGGVLSCTFNASTVRTAAMLRGVPVPDSEMTLLDRIVELARSDDFRLDMAFEPGDIQLLNNHTTVHWRTRYVDHPEPERRRR